MNWRYVFPLFLPSSPTARLAAIPRCKSSGLNRKCRNESASGQKKRERRGTDSSTVSRHSPNLIPTQLTKVRPSSSQSVQKQFMNVEHRATAPTKPSLCRQLGDLQVSVLHRAIQGLLHTFHGFLDGQPMLFAEEVHGRCVFNEFIRPANAHDRRVDVFVSE